MVWPPLWYLNWRARDASSLEELASKSLTLVRAEIRVSNVNYTVISEKRDRDKKITSVQVKRSDGQGELMSLYPNKFSSSCFLGYTSKKI